MQVSFSKKISLNFFIIAVGKYGSVLIQVLADAVLARLIIPEYFGLVASLSVFLNFFLLFSDLGIGSAVIQYKTLNRLDFSSLFWISSFAGLILGLIFIPFSYFMSFFYNADYTEYISMGGILGGSIFLSTVGVIPKAILQKDLKFRDISICEFLSYLLSNLFTIYLILHDFGFQAIVFRYLFLTGFRTICFLYYSRIKIYFFYSNKALKLVAKFSLFQFGFSIINYFSRNLDNILLGKYMGFHTLGVYDKSYQLMMLPLWAIIGVLSYILHPIFSLYKDDRDKIFFSYLHLLKILGVIASFISIFFFFSSEELVLLLYGVKWLEVIPIIKIFSLSIFIQLMISSAGSIFLAIGESKLLFVSGCISALTSVSAIVGGIYIKDIYFLCFFLTFAFVINFFQGFYFLIVKGFGSNYKSFLLQILPVGLVAMTSFVIFFLFNLIIHDIKLVDSLIITIIVKLLINILIFLFSVSLFMKYLLIEFANKFKIFFFK